MFWKREKKVPNGTNLAEIEAKFDEINRKITKFETRMMDIEMSYDVLRDKVLRKLQMKRHKDDEIDENKPNLDGLPRFGV